MKREGTDMIKGCQKKVVLIRSPKSPIFEEAYLIMRPAEEGFSDSDIVSEADRILSACREKGKKKRKWVSGRELLFFSAGVLLATVALGLLLLLTLIVNT